MSDLLNTLIALFLLGFSAIAAFFGFDNGLNTVMDDPVISETPSTIEIEKDSNALHVEKNTDETLKTDSEFDPFEEIDNFNHVVINKTPYLVVNELVGETHTLKTLTDNTPSKRQLIDLQRNYFKDRGFEYFFCLNGDTPWHTSIIEDFQDLNPEEIWMKKVFFAIYENGSDSPQYIDNGEMGKEIPSAGGLGCTVPLSIANGGSTIFFSTSWGDAGHSSYSVHRYSVLGVSSQLMYEERGTPIYLEGEEREAYPYDYSTFWVNDEENVISQLLVYSDDFEVISGSDLFYHSYQTNRDVQILQIDEPIDPSEKSIYSTTNTVRVELEDQKDFTDIDKGLYFRDGEEVVFIPWKN